MRYFEIEILPAAEKDLEDIWLYIAAVSPTAADRLLRQLSQRIFSLATMPERNQLRTDIAPTTRCLIERDYFVLYEVQEDRVLIVRVVHGAMDLTKIMG